ncbi:tail fiber assembly protein [Snodgrassella gandavensis]|uniref:tail fiber assembly protein n=1 Tax=Snodgrassella gandavensis TaxID=2946698 RepID=UPI001EF58FCE|nr:tail fiber assembly protein [Snodgrassella gandavensis]
MKIYAPTIPVCQLDENNYFVGMTTADLDPLENNGHYLIPRLCIQAEEPTIKKGFIAQWTGDNWQYIEDHRGETVYSKETGEVVAIDEPGILPATVTTMPCPDIYHQWSEKAHSWVEKADAAQLRLQNKRSTAGTLSRMQMLSQLEISLGKNKQALVEAAENAMSGIELIKIRNYILETQSFALTNELWWDFLTNILQIQQDNVFVMWEKARTI